MVQSLLTDGQNLSAKTFGTENKSVLATREFNRSPSLRAQKYAGAREKKSPRRRKRRRRRRGRCFLLATKSG
jgi:hypothetical protein